MNIVNHSLRYAVLIALLAGQTAVAAEDDRVTFSGDAAAGVKYDSNVNLLDLDTNTGRADAAMLLDLGLGADIGLTDKASLELGYDYSQTRYSEFSAFDLSIHRASAELEYDTGAVDTGFSLHEIRAALGGDDYLGMRRFSPSVARLFGNKLYLRGAYIRTDKDHRIHEGRSAVNDSISADAFLFLDGADRYVTFGLLAGSENAANDDFDYDARRLKLKYAERVEWMSLELELKSRLQFERRDYRQVLETEFLQPEGARRSDDRWRAGFGLDLPVGERLAVESGIEYTSNASNLEAADFDEMTYSVRLAAAF
jgi:opacity protein-like surface antigen